MQNKLTMKRGIFGVMAAFALMTVATSSYAQISVANASFENPSESNAPNKYEDAPSLAEQGGSGWLFFNGGCGIAANGGFAAAAGPSTGVVNAPDGTQAGVLQKIGMVQQSLSGFSIGSEYTVSFYAEGRNFGGANPLQVEINNTLLTFGSYGNTITPPVATNFTYYVSDPFTVTAGSNLLSIYGTDYGNGGNLDVTSFIDDVAVVPEPTSFALVIVGAMAMALLYRSRPRCTRGV
ncbi:MAG TPA: hypothetical protein VMP11_09140 [Verrucomicrobiae bacterium]|nr:hypothetical protein [Verrucomicrobiae bacterium]